MTNGSVQGFSLFEIALVLVVIGLLTTGIMKGYDLLQQARLQKTVSQILSIQTSVRLFRERYGAIPGDFSDASFVWGHSTRNGDGNGVVDGNPLDGWSEASLFWQHLNLAGLITNVHFVRHHDIHQAHGRFLPEMPLGCILLVESNPASLEGLWLVLTTMRHSRKYLTPKQAAFIDRQLDNGDPGSGQVRTLEAPHYSLGSCLTDGRYNLKSRKPACIVYIAVDD